MRCRRWRSASAAQGQRARGAAAGCRPTRRPIASPCAAGPAAHRARARRRPRHAAGAGPRHALARALGDVHRVQWVLHNVKSLEAGALFCWITGWTSDSGGDTLPTALRAMPGARAAAPCRRARAVERAAAAAQPAVGAALRDLQPRAGHARVERGRPDAAAGHRRAVDVRLHVRRRRPGPGASRRQAGGTASAIRSRGC